MLQAIDDYHHNDQLLREYLPKLAPDKWYSTKQLYDSLKAKGLTWHYAAFEFQCVRRGCVCAPGGGKITGIAINTMQV